MSRPTVVLVHGLGGTEQSLGDVPADLTAAGWPVICVRLPGHGTTVDDLHGVGVEQWLDAVTSATSTDDEHPVVIIGQSLGGVLALLVSHAQPTVAAVGLINAPVTAADPDVVEHLQDLLARGITCQPAGEPDLRDPHASDPSYDEVPVSALLALIDAGDRAVQVANQFHRPVLLVSSDHDQVVDPWYADRLQRQLPGPVTRVRLANSGHVACRDLDRQLLTAEILDWLEHLSAAST